MLEVLEAQELVIDAQISVAEAERDAVVNAFGVLQATGRMTAVRLGITDLVYQPEVHLNEVRRQPWGVSITYGEELEPGR